MGTNSSKDSANACSHPHAGFTPLTPLKRPGSIRSTSTRKSSELFEGHLPLVTEKGPEDEEQDSDSGSQNQARHQHDVADYKPEPLQSDSNIVSIPEASDESASPTAANNQEVPTDGTAQKHPHDDSVCTQSVSEPEKVNEAITTNSAAPTSGRVVYGAAYPPEMAETIMMLKHREKGSFTTAVLGLANYIIPTSQNESDSPCASPMAEEGRTSRLSFGIATPPKAGNPSTRRSSSTPQPSAPNYTAAQVETPESSQQRARRAKFDRVLSADTVDLSELQALCWSGCPPESRADAWRLLLRYAPASAVRRATKMERLRAEYADAAAQHFDAFDPATAAPYSLAMHRQIAKDMPRTHPGVRLFRNHAVQRSLHRILYTWAVRHPGTGYVQGINDVVTPFFVVFLSEAAAGATAQQVTAGDVHLDVPGGADWGGDTYEHTTYAAGAASRPPAAAAAAPHDAANGGSGDGAGDVRSNDPAAAGGTAGLEQEHIAAAGGGGTPVVGQKEGVAAAAAGGEGRPVVGQKALEALEADCYHCLTNLLDSAQDNYVYDSRGIQEKTFMLRRIVGRLDAGLCAHLEAMEVEFMHFAFRWFNCLLIREFPLQDGGGVRQCTLRLWDTYVAEGSFAVFHVYVCAALLLSFSKQLQKMDFQEAIMFLQQMPTDEWEESKMELLVAQAYSWSQAFSSASHL